MMKKAILLVLEHNNQSEQRFLPSIMVEGASTLRLFDYEFADASLNGKACLVEMDRGGVKKIVIEGFEYPKKKSQSPQGCTTAEICSGQQKVSQPVVSNEDAALPAPLGTSNREHFAYNRAYRRVIDEKIDKYSEQVNSLPMLIKHNGLGAALMYMRTKHADVLRKIYDDISDWLRQDEKQLLLLKNNEELAEIIIDIPQCQYKDITKEVLAYLAFLKRFAKGLSSQ
jgi:CRISPR-associated protein Cmr5